MSSSESKVVPWKQYRITNRFAPPDQALGRAYETRKNAPETAAPQPRRMSNISGIDHRCEKCYQSEPLLRDSAASLSKLVDSLTLGPMADLLSQVSPCSYKWQAGYCRVSLSLRIQNLRRLTLSQGS